MSPDEFRAEVEAKAGPNISRRAVREAVDHYLMAGGELYRETVRKAVQLAGRFHDWRPRTAEPSVEVLDTPAAPWAQLNRDQVLESWSAEVEEFRVRTFASPGVPFPGDTPAALNWVRRQYEHQESEVDLDSLRDRMGRSRPSDYSDREWRLEAAWQAISLGGGLPPLFARPDSEPLWTLATLSRDIERALVHRGLGSRLRAGAVYVLCGEPPSVPGFRVDGAGDMFGVINDEPREIPRAVVTLFTPELRTEDLARLRQEVRQLWWAAFDVQAPLTEWLTTDTRAPRVTEKDARLHEVVGRLGGVPKGSPRTFWERVAGEWAAETPGDAPEAMSLSRRWRRLQKKLDRSR